MAVPEKKGCSACYWNVSFRLGLGEAEQDEEGMRTMKVLGENIIWLLKKVNA